MQVTMETWHILSPILFDMFINDLMKDVQDLNPLHPIAAKCACTSLLLFIVIAAPF